MRPLYSQLFLSFNSLQSFFLQSSFNQENIAEIKGSLAYVLEYHHLCPTQLEIWVMDQGKWAKKYNIGPIETCMCGLSKNGDQVFGGG